MDNGLFSNTKKDIVIISMNSKYHDNFVEAQKSHRFVKRFNSYENYVFWYVISLSKENPFLTYLMIETGKPLHSKIPEDILYSIQNGKSIETPQYLTEWFYNITLPFFGCYSRRKHIIPGM